MAAASPTLIILPFRLSIGIEGSAPLRSDEDHIPQKIGRYIIIKSIGSGAMGTVYKAYDPKLSRTIAIKTIRCEYPTQTREYKAFLKRFRQEAEALGKLSHPGVVALYDMGETRAKVPFLAMEYVEGKTLAQLMKSGHSFETEQIFQLISQMADALDYAHKNRVLHCDIKPSNILALDGEDKLKITDFGISKVLDSKRTRHHTIQLVGTPGYMSPEQVMGKAMDERSDIFSLGVVAFEMLCGKQPFPGKSLSAVLVKQVHADPIVPSGLKELGIEPREWQQVFSRVLAKDPRERYQTASEFASDVKDTRFGSMPVSRSPELTQTTDATRSQRFDSVFPETLTLWTRRLIRIPQRKLTAAAIGGLLATTLFGLAALSSVGTVEKSPGPDRAKLAALYYPHPTLKRKPAEVEGTIYVESDPPAAEVMIDGEVLGTTPVEVSRLKMGDHSILIEKANCQPVELAVSLNRESPKATLSVSLREERRAQASPPVLPKSTPQPAPTHDMLEEALVPLKARVASRGRQILVKNDNTFDWFDVTLRVNHHGLLLNIGRINAGQAYTIVNPSNSESSNVEIWCETPSGSAYIRRGVDKHAPRASMLLK